MSDPSQHSSPGSTQRRGHSTALQSPKAAGRRLAIKLLTPEPAACEGPIGPSDLATGQPSASLAGAELPQAQEPGSLVSAEADPSAEVQAAPAEPQPEQGELVTVVQTRMGYKQERRVRQLRTLFLRGSCVVMVSPAFSAGAVHQLTARQPHRRMLQ